MNDYQTWSAANMPDDEDAREEDLARELLSHPEILSFLRDVAARNRDAGHILPRIEYHVQLADDLANE